MEINLGWNNRYPEGPLTGMPLSLGNMKLGEDTLIINMGAGLDCPSRFSGQCQVIRRFDSPHACYAIKAEKIYKGALPRRRRQQDVWQSADPSAIAEDAGLIVERYHELGVKIRYLRYSEAGDFRGQRDVDAMETLADFLGKRGIVVYGYTANRRLDFSGVSFVVRGSGWNGPAGRCDVFTKDEDIPAGYFLCPGNCRKCSACKTAKHRNIAFRYH